jgi:hypothetical protein
MLINEFPHQRAQDSMQTDFTFPLTEDTKDFFMAFALTEFDEGGDFIFDDPEIVSLKAYQYGWGEVVEQAVLPLELRPCTAEELGLNADGRYIEDQDFNIRNPGQRLNFPLKNGRDWVERYYKRMRCIDSDIELIGNWNTDAAKSLAFQVERCDPGTSKCKEDVDFEDYF